MDYTLDGAHAHAMVGAADLSAPTKDLWLQTAYRAAILCQVELETSEV